jgi:hypothetical protein
MTNVYILGLSYVNSTSTSTTQGHSALLDALNNLKGSAELEVRAGYFGMCVRQRGIVWLCSSDHDGLAQQIGFENDPLNLIGAAAKFKNDVLFSGILFIAVVSASISILLLATFPGWREERDVRTGSDIDVKPFPSRPVSQLALAATFVSAVHLLIASLWQHVGSVGAAAMAESANYGNVRTDIGVGAVTMIWVACALQFFATMSLLAVVISIMVLERLTDSD